MTIPELAPLSDTHPVPEQGPFACVVRGVVHPEHRDELLEIWASVREQDEAEPGTLVQAFHLDAADPTVFWIYELWASREALEEHRRNLHSVRDRIARCVVEWPALHFCTPVTAKGVPSGPPAPG